MICGGGLPATAAPQHFLDAPYRVHGALAQAGQLMIDLIKLFQHDAFSLRIPDLVDHLFCPLRIPDRLRWLSVLLRANSSTTTHGTMSDTLLAGNVEPHACIHKEFEH